MKKIIPACFIMLFTGSAIFAEQSQPAQEKTKTAKKEVAHARTHAAKTTEHHQQTTAAVKECSATTTATPLRKDGTPDKRYKKHSQHVKKDGTPDKRFKEKKQ